MLKQLFDRTKQKVSPRSEFEQKLTALKARIYHERGNLAGPEEIAQIMELEWMIRAEQ